MAYIPSKNTSVSGTVGASVVGLPYFGVAGSVATVGTAAANQSISGTIDIGVASGSVVAYPTGNQSVSGSVGIVGTPSISGAVTIVGSSSITALQGTNPWLVGNSSVQIMGIQPAHSVTALQGTNPWIVNQPSGSIIATQIAGSIMNVNVSGSVATVGTAAANQSISGQVDTFIVGGSITTVGGTTGNSSVQVVNFPTNQSISGAVTQGTDPWKVNVPTPSYVAYQLAGSTLAVSGSFSGGNSSVQVLNFPTNQSVSGNVGVVGTPSISGTVNIAGATIPPGSVSGSVGIVGTPSISGAVTIVGSSSITALQGTNPWIVNQPSGSIIATQIAGSIMATTATINNPNSSVQLITGSNVLGSIATLQGTNPWQVNVPTPSYVAYQLAGSVMATSATVTTGPSSVQLLAGVQPIGSVAVLQGTSPWLITGSVANAMIKGVSSVYLQAGSAAIGSVATLQGTSPWLITGSVMNAMTRGVASVYQGTSPWVVTADNNSVISADSYSEDAAHATGNRGTFIMGVRNDTLASITSADNDYSPFTVGPSGETIVANAPITKWISATTSVMAGPSVLVFAAPGASVFNYVSGYHITNPGTVAAHIAFSEGLGAVPASIMFFGIAPAGGGSNVVFRNPIKTTLANKNISASVSAHSSVYITMEGFTVKQLT
jgi:hypothetical protein